jgi:hypothetical protein
MRAPHPRVGLASNPRSFANRREADKEYNENVPCYKGGGGKAS